MVRVQNGHLQESFNSSILVNSLCVYMCSCTNIATDQQGHRLKKGFDYFAREYPQLSEKSCFSHS